MDAQPNSSSKNAPSVPNFPSPRNPRVLSYNEDDGGRRARKAEVVLRREHSDGEVVGTGPDFRIRPREYQGESSLLRPASEPMVPQDDTGDVGRSLAAARRRGVAADIMAVRKEITSDHARRRSSTHLSARASGASRIDLMASPRGYPLATIPNPVANPFASGDLNRPLPRRPSSERVPDRRSHEIILPRWQPDVEVTECPICHTAFGFWFRKHHCRRCGRVVCANCSPHRITIPRQFIVQPPEDAMPNSEPTSNAGPSIVDLTSDGEASRASLGNGDGPGTADYRIDSALGGGLEVRLCNPCVPDPNPMVPPSYYTPSRPPNPYTVLNQTPSSHGHPTRSDPSISLNDPRSQLNRSHSGRLRYRSSNGSDINPHMISPFPVATPFEPSFSGRRHSHQPHAVLSPNNLPIAYGSAPDQLVDERLFEEILRQRRSRHQLQHRQHASISGPPTGHTGSFWSREFNEPNPRPVPQPQLREEDECPICHGALPPKGADGSETAREAHVSGCIETHFSTSAPRASHPHPSTAVNAAVMASTTTPAQAGGTMDNPASGSSSSDRRSSTLFQQRRRTTGMVVYHATEKDCVGEDGAEAECVICFEEFSVGDEMGRLECLCKFHKVYQYFPIMPRIERERERERR